MGIKLLHTADLHLDKPFFGLGPRRLARRAEMRARFEEIVALAGQREAAALLIAGDLFDRPAAESGPWVKGLLGNAAAQGLRIFLIPGNHDTIERCQFYQGEFPPGVHVFRSSTWETNEGLSGVTIHGLAYRAAGRQRSPLAGLAREGGGRWRVGLLHGQLRSSEIVGEDYAPFEAGEIAACGLDYLALGHYHGFHDCSAGRTKACYPGSPYRLDFGDAAERRVLLVHLEDEGVRVEQIALPDREFREVEGDAARPEELYADLLRAVGPEVYLRVCLRGTAAEPLAGLVADLSEKLGDRCYGLEIVTGAAAGTTPVTQAGTVAHVFLRLSGERLQAAPDEETVELTRLAADYGLLALGGRTLP